MITSFKKISDRMNTLCMVIASGFLIILAVSCIIQVFGRYVFNASLTWPEELSRYSFVWSVMIGATILVKKKTHVAIDLLVKNLSGKKRHIHMIIISILITSTSLVLLVTGTSIVTAVYSQNSPAIEVSMSYAYAAIPIAALVMCIHCVNELVTDPRD
jgi:TRAP-type transport system small permease protein